MYHIVGTPPPSKGGGGLNDFAFWRGVWPKRGGVTFLTGVGGSYPGAHYGIVAFCLFPISSLGKIL